jgi:hypothetical protein
MFHLSLPHPRFSTFMTYHRIGNTWVHPRFSGVRIVPRFTAILFLIYTRDRRDRERMVDGFTTIYVLSAYHH